MDQKKHTDNQQQPQRDVEKNTSPEQGRVAGSNQQTSNDGTADISQVDQQEGQMNHGELGSNFDNSGNTKGA